MLGVVAQLFGEPAVLFKDKINFKMSGGDGFKAHQDAQAGWDAYASLHITAMLSIDPTTAQNGCLELAPDQHRRGFIGKSWEPLGEEDLRGMPFVACPTEPGMPSSSIPSCRIVRRRTSRPRSAACFTLPTIAHPKATIARGITRTNAGATHRTASARPARNTCFACERRSLLRPARWPAALKCTCVLLAMLVAPALACAHAVVVDSVPRNGAALSAAPRQIELRFNVRVEQAVTRAALVSHKGAPVPLTILPASESRSERVLIAVPSLGAGDYEVRYRVLATDGHATQGVLQFRVSP